ncbi:M56 family metallopeptidase [Brevibacterium casei]|uniref:M56 family metallopeptidase n=1 Tax=Brevibacterium casei TaxID=33889 RepID=UPI00223BC43F|nr:M56 family metallopeptidase [Brevibacterium casei]MCT1548999.1 M56 family metallopeptidase [Brevibacterium casei]MCT1558934.1 M56 family metallopeptidase [Brevibacterium casei]MCT2207209.1 M56 family metallopeptidase [Brevibacterium casei]
MSPALLTLGLGLGLIAFAVFGPWLLRHAAPALMRVPRLAIAVIGGGILVWLGTLLSIGPVLAWFGSGPALLPERAAAVCQRCLTAANPFDVGEVETAIPAILLLAIPALLILALLVGVSAQLMRRARRARNAARLVLRDAHRRQLHGFAVSVVDARETFALTFPHRHGGIIVSTGALDALDHDELLAVLAHEHAHLRQRHHLISAIISSLAAFLRWVPVVRAAADALPHYLEIAADNEARRHAGTPALVSALIKLGERAAPAVAEHACAQALHAAGPERIRQLVRPTGGLAGAAPTVMITAYLVVLGVASAAVHLPYASAALTGC